jgi:hypothetical protein
MRVNCSALEAPERRDLDQLEARIEHGLQTFRDVGEALLEIRERRLYRATHKTWLDYCRERWQFTGRHGNRLIRAAAIAGRLGPVGPTNERQARELDQVPAAQHEALLEQLRSTGRVSAEQIRVTTELLAALKPEEKLAQAQAAEAAALGAVARINRRERLRKIGRLCGRLAKLHAVLPQARKADAALQRYLAIVNAGEAGGLKRAG